MAEQPVMDSATENPSESVAPTPTPLNVSEAATSLKNLLDPEASKNQEVASEESTEQVKDSETNIDENLEDPELINQIEDETPQDTNQELYTLTVNGQDVEVTLDELKKGYSRQSDYTRKTEKLSQDRRAIEQKNEEVLKISDEAKIKRDQYDQQLQNVIDFLNNNQPNVNLDKLYKENPAEYVRVKAEQDKIESTKAEAKLERERILAEKQKEADDNYLKFVENEKKILKQKLPIYADEKKGPAFRSNLVEFARSQGFKDQEIAMLVDHRAIMLLTDAFRYNKIKKNADLKSKKVKKVSKVVSSSSPKISDDDDNVRKLKSQKANLKKSGSVQDAANVFQQMFSK